MDKSNLVSGRIRRMNEEQYKYVVVVYYLIGLRNIKDEVHWKRAVNVLCKKNYRLISTLWQISRPRWQSSRANWQLSRAWWQLSRV